MALFKNLKNKAKKAINSQKQKSFWLSLLLALWGFVKVVFWLSLIAVILKILFLVLLIPQTLGLINIDLSFLNSFESIPFLWRVITFVFGGFV